ncbi:hypothetical protein MOO45_08115 (plasmid) [Bombilactobacillus folatiphilus]|uniref:HTH tetR-type domain-containing protein n=1 Tax=Bombilactobacillus folatiphilus TaxID=2923362 RepID=A0ABY4PB90_9LACO|nr:hypothetical protein [Bombilactobacillus folatiphilus]UQS81427.1 hypothetical protein MOO45_04150 [Bombilactobacillus folatiphilus]UQS82840.1 hypothetical protein MOO45_04145 [Bombilactobacillus folatiphilus]UQS82946.1 hypothetical protein MOO45_08115 [Bombilactobacillus folatiphilus]
MVKVDARVCKTKLRIRHELVTMLQHQNINNISITKLCDQAQINRSTFYTHYNSTIEVLEKMESEVLQKSKEYLRQQRQTFDVRDHQKMWVMYLKLLNFYKANPDMTRALFVYPINKKFKTDLFNFSDQYNTYTDSYYQQAYTIAGGLEMIELWVKHDFDLSPERLCKLMVEMGPSLTITVPLIIALMSGQE